MDGDARGEVFVHFGFSISFLYNYDMDLALRRWGIQCTYPPKDTMHRMLVTNGAIINGS